MDSNNKKNTVHKIKDKPAPAPEELERFEQNIKKKIAAIQKKYARSVVNKLYIFPRVPSLDASTSQSESQEQIGPSYQLKSQNQISRKNQTKTDAEPSQNIKAKEYYSTRTENSVHSIEDGGRTLKNRKSKAKNIEISFDTKKKTPARNKNSSQRKLLAEQYSLDNRAYTSVRDGNGVVVSFRANKKHEINISLSGRRMKTEIN